MKLGSGALWLPLKIKFALLLFVAAPLRRFGAYTLTPTSRRRGWARLVRSACSPAAVVLLIAGFYLVPQLKGAGLTLLRSTLLGAPYWVGVVVVGAIRGAQCGLRGRHHLRAGLPVHYEDVAIARPACLLPPLGGLPERAATFGRELPRAGDAGPVVQLDEPQRVTFPEATS